jgi:hypothetical protein
MDWMHQVRTLPQQALPFAQRLAYHPDLSVLEVTQAPVDNSGGAAGGAGSEIVLLNQKRAFPGASALSGNGDAINSTTNDDYVEALTFQRWPGCSWRNHVSD